MNQESKRLFIQGVDGKCRIWSCVFVLRPHLLKALYSNLDPIKLAVVREVCQQSFEASMKDHRGVSGSSLNKVWLHLGQVYSVIDLDLCFSLVQIVR